MVALYQCPEGTLSVVQVVQVALLVKVLVCHQAQWEQAEWENARRLLLVGGSLVLVAHIAQLLQQPTHIS